MQKSESLTLLELFLWSELRSFFDPDRRSFPFPLSSMSSCRFWHPERRIDVRRVRHSLDSYCSCGRPIDLNLHHFSFDEFSFLSKYASFNFHRTCEFTHLIRTPIERRNACVSASVLLISSEKISLPDMAVNGVSDPKAWAMPRSME